MDQIKTLQHTTTIYQNPQIALYAKELAAKMPGNLKVCYFVNSGSEANDLAIMMARLYTGNEAIVGLRNAYHGLSPVSMALTAHKSWKYKLPLGSGIYHTTNPDPYRGQYGNDGPRYAEVRVQTWSKGLGMLAAC